MAYPEKFLKGIPNKAYIGDDNGPTSDLFYFQPEHQKEERDDGYFEESINWRDDSGADEIIFTQTKNDGSIQFQAGVAIMCRKELDRLKRKPVNKNVLSYERKKIPGNRYHGNLLLMEKVKKREMKKIAATIANICFLDILENPMCKEILI